MNEENQLLIADSKERVAFDLMLHISEQEAFSEDPEEKRSSEDDPTFRDYWLKLYGQCLAAVTGRQPG